MSDAPVRSREARIALILYGGVSLAIYENGVTQTFFDFVRERGSFKFFAELLDINATVDVIAGTSAGGINGLMLAAALESGADFGAAARLWREQGDLGLLLRVPDRDKEAESLLDGEGYYQERLTEAFRQLCTRDELDYESPGEIDVFITGTDVDGEIRHFWDSLGNQIDDKEHRTVFRLKHRPRRKALGLSVAKSEADPDTQAGILASIARITSTFPSAFPPFHISQIGAKQEEIGRALREMGQPFSSRDRTYIDGGVLNNKPFEPALDAIFHRMPDRLTDRRLFFVEPSPQQFDEPGDGKSPRADKPLGVVFSSLVSIPSHESIGDDLQRLIDYNARVRWIKEMKNAMRGRPLLMPSLPWESVDCPEEPAPHYEMIRRHSLAISFALQRETTPTAADYVVRKERQLLYGHLMQELRDTFGREGRSAIEPLALDAHDIAFHMRQAFHFLYEYFERLGTAGTEDPDAPPSGATVGERLPMLAVGRIIKAYKIIRVMLMRLRDGLLEADAQTLADPAYARALMRIVERFLAADAPQWEDLRRQLDAGVSGTDVRLPEDWDGSDSVPPASLLESFLDRETLSSLARAASRAVRDILLAAGHLELGDAAQSEDRAHQGPTVLDLLGRVMHLIVERFPLADENLATFRHLDGHLYPQIFTGGVYELDEIQFTRISPRDAKARLAGFAAGTGKVTGDKLAHFAAFLRRDWRSNDILWGRLDGIAQVMESFLDDAALVRLTRQGGRRNHLFEMPALQAAFPGCPAESLEKLRANWRRMQGGGGELKPSSTESERRVPEAAPPTAAAFRDQLILVAQMSAFQESVTSIFEDMHYQKILWGLEKGSRDTGTDSGSETIQADASQMARADLGALTPTEKWNRYLSLGIGTQRVTGPTGAIPHNIIGEYTTRGYLLLWGMIRKSLGTCGQRLIDRTRALTRNLPALAHTILVLLRHQATTAAVYVTALIVVLLTLAGRALWQADWHEFFPAAVGVILFAGMVWRGAPRLHQGRIRGVLIATTLWTILGFVVTMALVWLWTHQLWPPVQRWLGSLGLGGGNG